MFIMDEIRENTAGAIMTPEFVRLREGTRVRRGHSRCARLGAGQRRAVHALHHRPGGAAQGHAGDAHAAGRAGRRGRGGADGHGLHRRGHGCRPAGGGALGAQIRPHQPARDRPGGAAGGRHRRQQHRGRHRGRGHGGLRAHGRAGTQRGRLRGLQRLDAGMAPAAVAADPHGLGGVVRPNSYSITKNFCCSRHWAAW